MKSPYNYKDFIPKLLIDGQYPTRDAVSFHCRNPRKFTSRILRKLLPHSSARAALHRWGGE